MYISLFQIQADMNCCGCIPVKVGASLIAFIGILICAIELTLFVPYLMNQNECNYNIKVWRSFSIGMSYYISHFDLNCMYQHRLHQY